MTDFLYLGNALVARKKKELLNKGITHIAVVASGRKRYFPKEFKYVLFDIVD